MQIGPFRKAGEVELARRERLAKSVVIALTKAGLHAEVGGEGAAPGAQVEVEPDEDVGEFRTLLVTWNGPTELEDAVVGAMQAQRFDDPALEVASRIAEAMQPAIVAVLMASGFTVRPATDDLVPFSVEVIESN